MFRGRVLAAHNAPFDYGFLAEEFVAVAAIDGVVTFGVLGAVEVTVGPGDGERPRRRRRGLTGAGIGDHIRTCEGTRGKGIGLAARNGRASG